jgi:hypothetical protein
VLETRYAGLMMEPAAAPRPVLALVLAASLCALLAMAGMIGWLKFGPDMVLALGASGLSLCF